ncbi:MAG: DUF6931 family protein, partial [Bryobacteraceae bacterium]
ERLARSGEIRAAIAALAQSLPAAEAVAWALASIRQIEPAGAKPEAAKPEFLAAIESIERWLAEPNDELRRAAKLAADRAGIATPAGCLALAIFFSGGSIAPAEAPAAPQAPPEVCGKMVAGAMNLAAALDPRNAPERLRAFFDQGMRAAAKLKIWEKEA